MHIQCTITFPDISLPKRSRYSPTLISEDEGGREGGRDIVLLKLKAMSQGEGLNIVTEVVPALIYNWTENIFYELAFYITMDQQKCWPSKN